MCFGSFFRTLAVNSVSDFFFLFFRTISRENGRMFTWLGSLAKVMTSDSFRMTRFSFRHGDVCLVLAFQYSDRSSHNHSAFHFLGSSYLYFCFEIFGVATVISLKVHVELVNWDTAGMFFSFTLCV